MSIVVAEKLALADRERPKIHQKGLTFQAHKPCEDISVINLEAFSKHVFWIYKSLFLVLRNNNNISEANKTRINTKDTQTCKQCILITKEIIYAF